MSNLIIYIARTRFILKWLTSINVTNDDNCHSLCQWLLSRQLSTSLEGRFHSTLNAAPVNYQHICTKSLYIPIALLSSVIICATIIFILPARHPSKTLWHLQQNQTRQLGKGSCRNSLSSYEMMKQNPTKYYSNPMLRPRDLASHLILHCRVQSSLYRVLQYSTEHCQAVISTEQQRCRHKAYLHSFHSSRLACFIYVFSVAPAQGNSWATPWQEGKLHCCCPCSHWKKAGGRRENGMEAAQNTPLKVSWTANQCWLPILAAPCCTLLEGTSIAGVPLALTGVVCNQNILEHVTYSFVV